MTDTTDFGDAPTEGSQTENFEGKAFSMTFQEINEEINYLDKEKNLTIEEELHYPIIIQKDSKINVSV